MDSQSPNSDRRSPHDGSTPDLPPHSRLLDFLGAKLTAWALFCYSRPWRVLLIATLLLALGGIFAAQRLRVNTNPADMISAKLDYRQRERAFNDAFPVLRNQIVVIVRAPSRDETDRFTHRLAGLLSAKGQPFDSIFAPSIDPFFARNGLLYKKSSELDSIMGAISRAAPLLRSLTADPSLDNYFAALADGLTHADQSFSEKTEGDLTRALAATDRVIEARLQNDPTPLAWSNLVDGPPDKGYVEDTVIVRPVLDFHALQPARKALGALDAAIKTAKADPLLRDTRVEVTGDPALRADELKAVASGIGWSFLGSLVAVAALVGLALRSIRHTLLLTFMLVWTIVTTAGLAAIFYRELNLVSMAFTVLLVGLGVDYSIHIFLVAQDHRRAGADGPAALRRAVDELGPASALCALTTIIGFAAFVPTAFVGMGQLGVLGALGVFIATLAAFTLLPAGLALWPAKTGRPSKARVIAPKTRNRLALVTALGAAAALFALPYVHFNADPMALRDPNSPSVKAFALLFDEPLHQPYRLSVTAKDAAAAHEVAMRAKTLADIDHVTTAADLVPGDLETKHDVIDAAGQGVLLALDDPGPPPQRAPDAGLKALRDALLTTASAEANQLRATLSRYDAARKKDPALEKSLEGDVFAFWPGEIARLKTALAPDFDIAFTDLPAFLQQSYKSADGRERVEIAPKGDLREEKTRADFVAQVTKALPEATGPALNLAKAGEVVSRSMATAVAAAFALCTILLLWLLRDWRVTLAMLAPVAMAGLLVLAAGVVLDLPFNYANVIVLPLLIGAGVDSGIHLALRARHAGGVTSALESSTPRAVFYSAATTIASFGSLILSHHQGVASMGKLLVLALGATLLCTLYVQPILLRWLGRDFEARSEEEARAAMIGG